MDLSGSPISQTDGTWDPTRTGSNTLNRPFDSYLTIGGIASSGNSTRAASNDLGSSQLLDSSWGGSMLPSTGFSWRTSNDSAQGRVGNSAGVLGTDVRLGQFVLSTGHAARTYSLSILYNGGEDLAIDESNGTLATGTFTLGSGAGAWRDVPARGRRTCSSTRPSAPLSCADARGRRFTCRFTCRSRRRLSASGQALPSTRAAAGAGGWCSSRCRTPWPVRRPLQTKLR